MKKYIKLAMPIALLSTPVVITACSNKTEEKGNLISVDHFRNLLSKQNLEKHWTEVDSTPFKLIKGPFVKKYPTQKEYKMLEDLGLKDDDYITLKYANTKTNFTLKEARIFSDWIDKVLTYSIYKNGQTKEFILPKELNSKKVTLLKQIQAFQKDEYIKQFRLANIKIKTTDSLNAKQIEEIMLKQLSWQINKEGLYISSASYKNGELGKGTTKSWITNQDSNIIMPLGKWKGWGASSQSIAEFAAGDSFFVVYNGRDDDGYAPKDFIKNLWFNDTSIAHAKKIDKINEALGHTLKQGGFGVTPQIRFKSNKNGRTGFLSAWVGSQTNHLDVGITFDQALGEIEKKVKTQKISQVTFDSIADYYGVNHTKNTKGIYEKNASIKNPASKFFMPVFQGENYFTYEKVTDRIFKVTFNNGINVSTTAAIWKFESTINKKDISYGAFSLGGKVEWSKYENNSQKYNFQARKNMFLSRS